MPPTDRSTVIGVFQERDQAERANAELRRAGFPEDGIGLEAGGGEATARGVGPTDVGPASPAGAPRRGAARAAASGRSGLLEGLNMSDEQARYYERELQAGRIIMAVRESDRASEAAAIMRRFGAHEVEMLGVGSPLGALGGTDRTAADERTIELREEELVAHKELREVGEVTIRTELEEFPGRLEVEAYREEVEVEHVPIGQVVNERVPPWEEDGVMVVPVYEEQLVVVKRLLLREHLRIRRVATTERQLFEDTLRRERLVVDDPGQTGLVHERYLTDDELRERYPGYDRPGDDRERDEAESDEPGFLERLGRKVLQ
jgi:uncharacterized protein (TIGR02271 family)